MGTSERLEDLERALLKDPENAALRSQLAVARERSGAPDPRSTWPVFVSRRVHIWSGYKKDRYPTACGKELKRGKGREYGDSEAVDCAGCLASPIGQFLSGEPVFPTEEKMIPERFYERYGKTTSRAASTRKLKTAGGRRSGEAT